ncbi:MAG: class II fructose-bisphosphate aldolase [Kosmotoga sp.]|nr:MAG: class II fructose-bisphosphate aldolase [Kosmotoga sp.]
MNIVRLDEILYNAKEKNYAVPAFNFYTYEEAYQIVKAAHDLSSPVILMSTNTCVKHLGLELIVEITRRLSKITNIPVAIHLDHATELPMIFRAMSVGFTSVMFDGSRLPFEENIKITKMVLQVGRSLKVSVEAEIGRVGNDENGNQLDEVLTTPEEAKVFFQRTQVDALAVAIGTVHGMQTQKAVLNIDLAKEISKKVDVPLVLHGSSGVKDEDMKELIKTNFSKINIGTRLKNVYSRGIIEYTNKHPDELSALNIIKEGSKSIYEVVINKIKLLKSENMA